MNRRLDQTAERLERRFDASIVRLDQEIEAMDPKWAAIDKLLVTDLVKRNADFPEIAKAVESRALNRLGIRPSRRLERLLGHRVKGQGRRG